MDAIAEIERQLQAAAAAASPADRAVKLRALREQINDLLGYADRLTAGAHQAREADHTDRLVRRLGAREDADLREVALAEDGDLTPEELDGAGFLSHQTLDELAEEGLLEEGFMGRGGRRIAFDAFKHPRAAGGRFRETPDAPKGKRPVRREDAGKDRKKAEPEKPARRSTPEAEAALAEPRPKQKPIAVSDVDEAVRLLGQGRAVELNQPREVSTLVSKLNEIVEQAKARGEKAPMYDLCLVSVKGTNIFCADTKGIPRARMPQLKGEPTPGSRADALPRDKRGEVDLSSLFRDYLVSSGIKVERDDELASHLRASQRELNGVKVAGIANYLESGGTIEGPPIFVSRNNYIVDGHHRWAAEVSAAYADGNADEKMTIDRIDLDILEILVEANLFAQDWGIPQSGMTNEAAVLLEAVLGRRPELTA